MKYLITILLVITFVSCSENLIQPESIASNSETIRSKVRKDGIHDLLGWGYDPTLGYLSNNYSQLQVIDVDRLYTEQKENFYYWGESDGISIIVAGRDAVDWSTDLMSKFNGSATFNQMTTSMNFDVTQNRIVSSKYSYATYFKTISLQREKLHHTMDVLRNYLTPNFINSINTLSPNEIISNFGTHVLTDITLGGKLEVDYKQSVNSGNKKLTVIAMVSEAIDNVFSLTATNNAGSSYKVPNTQFICSFQTIGGDPGKSLNGNITNGTTNQKINYDTWSHSVTLNNSRIVDIGDNSLIPIYEFVTDSIKKEALKVAVENYLNSKKVTSTKGSILCPFSLNKTNDRIVSLDYNGDGVKDILCYSPGYGLVSLNAGLKDGTFHNIYFNLNGLSGYNFLDVNDQLTVLDYNGDGKDDLMCYRPGSGIVFIVRSNGDGTFTTVYAPTAGVGIGGYNFKDSNDRVIALDYNGDGKDDLMCYRPGSGIVFVIRSNGDGTFTTVYAPSGGIGIGGYDFRNTNDKAIAFDYNGDGYEDILSYRPGSKTVYISKSNGNGTFTNVYASSNGIGGYDFSKTCDLIIPLDLNGDKYSDLLCYRPGSKIVYLLKSNGNTTFANVMQSTNGISGYNLDDINDKIISLDYNNDKLSDLILYRPGKGIAFSTSYSSSNSNFFQDYPY